MIYTNKNLPVVDSSASPFASVPGLDLDPRATNIRR